MILSQRLRRQGHLRNALMRHLGSCVTPSANLVAFAKLASINLLIMLNKTENFPATALRLFLVYGPYQKMDRLIPQVIGGCLKKKTFLFPKELS